MTRSLPLARPSRACGFAPIPFAASQAAQVPSDGRGGSCSSLQGRSPAQTFHDRPNLRFCSTQRLLRPQISCRMDKRTLTLGHSPDPDDAFMFYGLAKELIATNGFRFEHILQDIQTLNERATRGELDITAVSIHAYAYVSSQYALLPSGASMGDGYGPMLVAKEKFSKEQIARKKIAVP